MRVAILGAGNLAQALGQGWSGAGHELIVASRRYERAEALAGRLGPAARADSPREAVRDADAVLLAVPWAAVPEALRAAGGTSGALAGVPLIDPTNPVEHGVGELLVPAGRSAAQRVAELAVGAHVVKAFHLFPAGHWTSPGAGSAIVPLCGDDPGALTTVETLVTDLGARSVVLGTLARARQLEEAAGFVIGLAFRGADPARAVAPAEEAV